MKRTAKKNQNPQIPGEPIVIEKLFTIGQVAERLVCSISTVKRRLADGKMRFKKDGRVIRVPAAALQDYLAAIETPAFHRDFRSAR